jgi:hypothetical protein
MRELYINAFLMCLCHAHTIQNMLSARWQDVLVMSCKGLCILIFDGKTSESASSGGVRGISTYHDIGERYCSTCRCLYSRFLQNYTRCKCCKCILRTTRRTGKSKCPKTDRRKWSWKPVLHPETPRFNHAFSATSNSRYVNDPLLTPI